MTLSFQTRHSVVHLLLGASGTGGAIEVIISPKEGHGNDAVTELGGHYVMTATTLSQDRG